MKIKKLIISLAVVFILGCSIVTVASPACINVGFYGTHIFDTYEFVGRSYDSNDNYISSDDKYICVRYYDNYKIKCICGYDGGRRDTRTGYEKMLFNFD